MIHRISRLTALLFLVTAASAASVVAPSEVHAAPVLPHGLDWNLLILPDPEIPLPKLSEADLQQLLPRMIHLGHSDTILTIGPGNPNEKHEPVGPIAGMLAGMTLLLAAYELIPRAHMHILRLRSANFSRDLFS